MKKKSRPILTEEGIPTLQTDSIIDPIPVFIGISHRFDMIKDMTANSIRANTSVPVNIQLLYPKVDEGCTGFSNVRYKIKRGIYLDCDMVVLGDIAELWSYQRPGKYVCMKDGQTEVAVVDCEHTCTNKHNQQNLPKECIIPPEWNVYDFQHIGNMPENTKLLHFTDLKSQPWIHDHPDADMVALYEHYNNLLL